MYVHDDGVEYASYGAYLRSKNLRIGYTRSAAGWDLTRQKHWDRELSDFREARRQGMEPAGTDRRAIDYAVKQSDLLQEPYRAGKTLPSMEE